MTPKPIPSPSSTPRIDRAGIALRVALFAIIGWVSLSFSSASMIFLLGPVNTYFVVSALATFSAAAIANAITVRVYERGTLSDLGLGWGPASLREFLTGTGAAAAVAVVILAAPLAGGVATFEPTQGSDHPAASLLFVSAVLLFGAVGEEMLFRGYAFQLLVRSIGPFATILPTSVLFGLAHLRNENSTALGILNTMLWGVLFGYAYLRTGALWLPIGLHFGWNVTLPLFGVNLSGFTMGVTGYALHWKVGSLWSGGAYGPEGSVLTTAVVVVLFLAVRRLFPERIED